VDSGRPKTNTTKEMVSRLSSMAPASLSGFSPKRVRVALRLPDKLNRLADLVLNSDLKKSMKSSKVTMHVPFIVRRSAWNGIHFVHPI
jgi:hypothetical protein